eukprot:TRINITY_DN15186_c0_g1_i1.p1 TRINITY_DN15186_c0_g1~~TRINITY_DN15186_c0_g1_i1.p1  ORF type:complete len:577 (+),score=92.80 TRINITY_DN15186_c0_g1_i1:214-1944(+)
MRRSPNWFQPWWDSAYYAASVTLGITSLAWIVGGTFSSSDIPDQKVSNETDEYSESQADGDAGPYYVFVLTSCSIVFQRLYFQLFYQHHLVRILSSIIDQLTDIHQFRNTENSIVFTNALHRSEKSSFLLKVFLTNMFLRGSFTLASSVFVIMSSSPPIGQTQAKLHLYLFLWSLTIGLLCLQLCALICGVFWCFLSRNYAFCRLMTHYTLYLGKIDIARGRSVPSPVENHRPHQVLPPLNPYSSSRDLRLLLDLLATKVGTGIALRCLAGLETDLADSWAATGLQLETEEGSLVVYWKDPIVMSYMPLCVVKVHYGVEVEIAGYKTQTRIISHEEVRFMKQTWRANNPSAVELGADDDFIYHENFSGFSVLFPCTVRVWTIVNGQLVSSAERRIIGNDLFQDILPTGSSTPRFSVTDSNFNCSNTNITRLNVEYTEQELLRSRDGSMMSKASMENRSVKSNSVNFCEKNNSIELVRSSKESFATLGSGIGEANNTKLVESPTIRLSVKGHILNTRGTDQSNGKAVSETNLTIHDKTDSTKEAFSRKANNRKSLPAGHMNMAFVTDDDGKDPFLLI